MKRLFTTICFLILAVSSTSSVDASWMIDPWKYHVSAHGEVSCQDCHEQISEKDLHPDPADVNRKIREFINTEDQCISCHDNIPDDLDEGVHGASKIEKSIDYMDCFACHDPHEQPMYDEMRGGYDPARDPREQCNVCHEEQSELPPLESEDQDCMSCHGLDVSSDRWKVDLTGFCLHCHGGEGTQAQKITKKALSFISTKEYESSSHPANSCEECHINSERFPHNNKEKRECLDCHTRHDEKVTHDSHAEVACESCHLEGVKPVRDPESKKVLWERLPAQGGTSKVHNMAIDDYDASCRKCHFKGNQIGASAKILPAKGLLCMPCHAATFSIGDTPSIIALLIFLGGLILLFSVWLSGSSSRDPKGGAGTGLFRLVVDACKAVFSRKILLIIKAMIVDVLLQRRLYRQSKKRWAIHSLIFLPFVFRFLYGLIALVSSLWRPEWQTAWAMLDKNNPVTGLLFDISGIMILLGIILAFIRGVRMDRDRPAAVPRQDRLALCLIGLIVIVGFILEGMRISMTGRPDHAGFAFIGFWISRLFSDPAGLTDIYGNIWYFHAVLTGVFIAYLPFSRLLHIIVGPLLLAANAVSDRDHGKR